MSRSASESVFSASEAERIRTFPASLAVVPDRSVYAPAVDRRGRILKGANDLPSVGHGWESAALTPYALTSGHAPPFGRSDVVVDTRLASEGALHVGDRVRILTIARPAAFTSAASRRTAASHELPEQSAVFFRTTSLLGCRAAATASTCSGILTRPGADPAKRRRCCPRRNLVASGLRMLTGAKRGDAESPDDALSREDIVAGLTVFAILAAFVAIFVVASTFSLSVQQRHRELALFRAIGSTPRQVRRHRRRRSTRHLTRRRSARSCR